MALAATWPMTFLAEDVSATEEAKETRLQPVRHNENSLKHRAHLIKWCRKRSKRFE